MSVLSKPYFHDEQAAFDFVEGIIWPQGPSCPKCGAIDRISAIKPNPEKRVRFGLKKCGHCKSQFTVRMGTVFEESKLPMTKWLQAIYLMSSSKKGVSAHQLHRTLEVTYKTAWFLAHRIREAMRSGELAVPFSTGGGGVEVDETFIGREPGAVPGVNGQQRAVRALQGVVGKRLTYKKPHLRGGEAATVAEATPLSSADKALADENKLQTLDLYR